MACLPSHRDLGLAGAIAAACAASPEAAAAPPASAQQQRAADPAAPQQPPHATSSSSGASSSSAAALQDSPLQQQQPPKPRPAAAPRGAKAALDGALSGGDIVKSGYADAEEMAAAEMKLQSMPARTLTAANDLLADLPASLLPVVIAKSTARRGKGGRQPAADPRLDPSMDPKRCGPLAHGAACMRAAVLGRRL
jgi:hypothetical protein